MRHDSFYFIELKVEDIDLRGKSSKSYDLFQPMIDLETMQRFLVVNSSLYFLDCF